MCCRTLGLSIGSWPTCRGAGLGKVGWHLACRLRKAGATVIGCDVDPARAQAARARLQIATVDPEDIYRVAADIFAPCALGGAISELTLPRLRVEIIAGSANNQILSAPVAEESLPPRHSVRPGLRDQRRWPGECVRGNARLRPEARLAVGAAD